MNPFSPESPTKTATKSYAFLALIVVCLLQSGCDRPKPGSDETTDTVETPDTRESASSAVTAGGATGRTVDVRDPMRSAAARRDGAVFLDASAVEQKIKHSSSAVQRCYKDVLKTQPDTAGKVVLQFTVQASGEVTNAEVVESTVKSDPIGDCVKSIAQRWRFDARPRGKSETFRYPFVFAPENGPDDHAKTTPEEAKLQRVVHAPAPPVDLKRTEEALEAFPKTADGKPILMQAGDPSGSSVALVYDKSKQDTPVTRYAACLSRVTACAKTNTIETAAECIPMIERCPTNEGGEACCPPACIEQFQALIAEGKELMSALNESFIKGDCFEGLNRETGQTK